MNNVRVVGAGAFVPKRVVTNERIARAIPGWTPERIEEKTGIRERRFLWDFDPEKGKALPPPADDPCYPACNVDMCEVALRGALEMAAIRGEELDALFVVTCTPDELHFSHDAMALHQRLGCRRDTFALGVDDGCAGTPYVIDLARRLIESGVFRTVAVVASAFTSPLVNREIYTAEVAPAPGRSPLNGALSMYVFGDGAGAVVLRGEEAGGEGGIFRSMAGNDYGDLVLRRGGGQLRLPYQDHATPGDLAFVVDGTRVARSYPVYMQRCIEAVTGGDASLREKVKRFYFHQPNKRLMDHFVAGAGLAPERVACNVDRYGNTSAAGMLILLAEDLQAGTVRLGAGDLVLIAAVGANVHYGAQLIRL